VPEVIISEPDAVDEGDEDEKEILVISEPMLSGLVIDEQGDCEAEGDEKSDPQIQEPFDFITDVFYGVVQYEEE
jgi:hypothetical protein